MRRSYLLVLVAVPVGVALFSHGCSGESSFESVCDWVADPDNCFREFRAGMLSATATGDSVAGDCTFVGSSPTQVDPATGNDGTPNGAFQTTGMLATCFISTGGSVVFNPPINLAAYPPGLESTPVTYQMTIMDASGNTCGTFSYTSPHGFGITINKQGAGGGGAGGSSGGPGGSGGFFVINDAGTDGGFQSTPDFGTYTQTISPGLDEFNVSCPSGETHFFNLDESGDSVQAFTPDTSACPGYSSLVPSAALQIDPGGVNRPGAVSFAIVYPNTTATYPPFQSVGSADGFNPDATNVPKPQTVVYFNCSVPGAAPQCMDGTKDGSETDVDCGGPAVNGCPARCQGGQMCECNNDCSSNVCFVDPTSGSRLCYDPASPPMQSDGGTFNPSPGVGKCDYTSVCDSPNTNCSTGCTSLATDANNCGSCGNVCPGSSTDTTATSCCGGKCIDTTSDANNCGNCGTVCCAAAPTCSSSICVNTNDAGAACGG